MKSVKVKKKDLLKIVKENRDKHEETFNKAWKGYKEKVINELERRLTDAKEGKKINVYFDLIEPINQTKDYDRTISMLKMSVDDTIELSQREYSCFVLDEWDWSHQFNVVNSSYIKNDY